MLIFIGWKLSSKCRLSPYANLIQSQKGVQYCLHNNTILMYFCQFSELDTATYVGHRRLLCRGGAGPHGVYDISRFPAQPHGRRALSVLGVKIPSTELHWYWYCLNAQKNIYISLRQVTKTRTSNSFRRNENKICYEPWAPLVMQLNYI